jgi:hypothetical protein
MGKKYAVTLHYMAKLAFSLNVELSDTISAPLALLLTFTFQHISIYYSDYVFFSQ